MNKKFLSFEVNPDYIELISSGEWTLDTINQIDQKLKKISGNKKIIWDVSEVTDFDSSGVLLFIKYFDHFKKSTTVDVKGFNKKQEEMYLLLKKNMGEIPGERKENYLESIGKSTMDTIHDIKDFITFIGHLFTSMFHVFMHPGSIRFKEVVYHARHSGFNAIIIIGLTSFLVGMVIAYQGSVQLAKFGADIFIVDTTGISIVRELGPMITAIVIAGRSGSAYTAEIGAMKITEEISAMRTMGFDPYYFLVLPRVFALVLTLPLLVFFSDMMGIFGGLVASNIQLNISITQFIDRLYEVLEVKHYILGIIKAPVFAFLIAAVGCFRGFEVSDNTESLGLHTTASVVNSIFLVIVFDALFSVIYTEFGV